MLLFSLKKCASRAQMCQLVTHNIYSKNLMKMQKPCFHSIGTNKSVVPRLMYDFKFDNITKIELYFCYLILRFNIDNDFKWNEFIMGAKQAITIVTHALAEQKYDLLDGMINKRALKVLKCRVDLLTPEERKLLPVNFDDAWNVCRLISLRHIPTKDTLSSFMLMW